MSDKPAIAIIGPGRVGTTLAILAARAGYVIAGVAGRNADRARAAASAIGPNIRVGAPAEIAPLGQLVLLTVHDDAIAPVCRQLADARAFAAGAVVAHCSGAIASSVLAPARACGAAVGSLHPLQTFPNAEMGVKDFPGTHCFCEGDAPALAVLETLASAIGGQPVRLSGEGKLLYHATAVLAGNYFVGLIDAALATAGHAGIARADALSALAGLLRATLENLLALGPEKALTGPIARGDAGLVARQCADIAQADPRLGEIYRVLGDWTIDVAVRKGTIDPPTATALRRALGRKT
jgi:predicted short-subunit dehydrogenase-like oxidoreductase (DUF2520 family)